MFWLATALMYNSALILICSWRVTCTVMGMLCSIVFMPVRLGWRAICTVGKACVTPLRWLGLEAPTGTGGPRASDARAPVAGSVESVTAGMAQGGSMRSKTTTAASPGPRGHVSYASRIVSAALAAGVLCGAACFDIVALTAMLTDASQQVAEDMWVVSAPVAHACSPMVTRLSPWPVSRDLEMAPVNPVEGEQVELALYRLLSWSLVIVGTSAPLTLAVWSELVSCVQVMCSTLPHALAPTHDAVLVIYEPDRFWGAYPQLMRVYEGSVLSRAGGTCLDGCCVQHGADQPCARPLHPLLAEQVTCRAGSALTRKPAAPAASGSRPVSPCQGSSCSSAASFVHSEHDRRHRSSAHRRSAASACTSQYCACSMFDLIQQGCSEARRLCTHAHRAAVVCMAGRQPTGQRWFKPIPQNLSGIALHEACVAYQRECLLEHMREPQDQQFFIVSFETACGFDSAIYNLINSKVYNATLNWQSPKEYALQMAARLAQSQRSEEAWASQFSDSAEYVEFTRMVSEYYPAFTPDPALVEAHRQAAALCDPSRTHAEYMNASALADMLQQQMDQARSQHESRTPMERYQYLLTHDDQVLRQRGEVIRTYLQTQKDLLGVRQDLRYRQKPFNAAITDHKDLKALDWLVRYVVRHHGSISELHVHVWRTRRMSLGQAPRDAVAKLRDEGKVLADLADQRLSFDLNRELLDMLSRPASGFWPPALWKRLQDSMLSTLSQPSLADADQESLITQWAETAQRIYDTLQSSMPTEYAQMREQLTQRGEWKPWTQLEDAYHRSLGGQGTPARQPRNTRQPRGQGEQPVNDNTCRHCHQPGHWARDCPKLREEMSAQRGRGQQPRTAMTTTPAPGTNQLAVGMNPKAAYNKGQPGRGGGGRPGGQHHHQGGRPDGIRQPCPHCSRVAGHDYGHPGRCWLAEGVAPPAELNPRHPKIRDALNQLRRRLGLAVPEPPREYLTPRAASAHPQQRARFNDERDPNAGGASSSYRPRVAAMRAAPPSVRDRVTFNPDQLTFTCNGCRRAMTVSRTGSVLHGIHCEPCGYNFPADRLPHEWRHPQQWEVQPESRPQAFGSALSASVSRVPTAPASRMVHRDVVLRLVEGDKALSERVSRPKAQDACILAAIVLAHAAAKPETLSRQSYDLFHHCLDRMPDAMRAQQREMWSTLVWKPYQAARSQGQAEADVVAEVHAAEVAADQELNAERWQTVGRGGRVLPAQAPGTPTSPPAPAAPVSPPPPAIQTNDAPLLSRRSPPRSPGPAASVPTSPPTGHLPELAAVQASLAGAPVALQLASPSTDPTLLARLSGAERQLTVLEGRVSDSVTQHASAERQLHSVRQSVDHLAASMPAVHEVMTAAGQHMQSMAESVRAATTAQTEVTSRLASHLEAVTIAVSDLAGAVTRAQAAAQPAAPMHIDADVRVNGVMDQLGSITDRLQDLSLHLEDMRERINGNEQAIAAQQLLLGASFKQPVTVVHTVSAASQPSVAATPAASPAPSPRPGPSAMPAQASAPSPRMDAQEAEAVVQMFRPASHISISSSSAAGTASSQPSDSVPASASASLAGSAAPEVVRYVPAPSPARQRSIDRKGKRPSQSSVSEQAPEAQSSLGSCCTGPLA